MWSELQIWQDVDQDGESDSGELKTLSELGIGQINLTYDDGSAFLQASDDITVFGNTLHGLASFTRNGQVVTGGVGDLSLQYGANDGEAASVQTIILGENRPAQNAPIINARFAVGHRDEVLWARRLCVGEPKQVSHIPRRCQIVNRATKWI